MLNLFSSYPTVYIQLQEAKGQTLIQVLNENIQNIKYQQLNLNYIDKNKIKFTQQCINIFNIFQKQYQKSKLTTQVQNQIQHLKQCENELINTPFKISRLQGYDINLATAQLSQIVEYSKQPQQTQREIKQSLYQPYFTHYNFESKQYEILLYQQQCKPFNLQWLNEQHDSQQIQTKRISRLLQTSSQFQSSIYSKTVFKTNDEYFYIPAALQQPDTTYITPFNQKQANMFCAGCNKPLQQEQQCWWCYYSGQMYCNSCQSVAMITPGSLQNNMKNEVTKLEQQMNKLVWNEDTLPIMFKLNKNIQKLIDLRRQILSCLIYNQDQFNVCCDQTEQLKTKDILLLNQYKNIQFNNLIQKYKTNEHTKILKQILTQQHYHLIDTHEAVFYRYGDEYLDLDQKGQETQRIACQNVGYFTYNDISVCQRNNMILVALQDVINYLKQNQFKTVEQYCTCYHPVTCLDQDVKICKQCGSIYHRQCHIFIDNLCQVCYTFNQQIK